MLFVRDSVYIHVLYTFCTFWVLARLVWRPVAGSSARFTLAPLHGGPAVDTLSYYNPVYIYIYMKIVSLMLVAFRSNKRAVWENCGEARTMPNIYTRNDYPRLYYGCDRCRLAQSGNTTMTTKIQLTERVSRCKMVHGRGARVFFAE